MSNSPTRSTNFHLWDLPMDILNLILQNITFEDYVQLMSTCKTLRDLLDTQTQFETVWRSSFQNTTRAFEWLESDDILMKGGWRQLYGRIQEIERKLDQFDSMNLKLLEVFSLSSSEEANAAKTDQVRWMLVNFGTDPNYFIPLVHLSTKYWNEFCLATEDRRKSFGILKMCLTRRLLHLQNVNAALTYFHKANSEETENIEKCLFEVSRFDFGFSELAFIRQQKLQEMRKIVAKELPIQNGVLGFVNESMFVHFISSVGQKIMSVLPKPHKDGLSTNLLREFVGQPGEPRMYRLAILAKILQEEIFSKLKFHIGKQVRSFSVSLTGSELLIGPLRFRLKTNYTGISLMESGEAPPSQPVNYESAIFHCTYVSYFKLLAPKQSPYPSISEEPSFWYKYREHMRAILKGPPHSKHENWDPSDFGLGGLNAKVWPLDIAGHNLLLESPSKQCLETHGEQVTGKITMLKSGALAVTIDHDESSGPYVYTHDSEHLEKYDGTFLWPLNTTSETIQWLMKSRGFNMMGIFDLSDLNFGDSGFWFSGSM